LGNTGSATWKSITSSSTGVWQWCHFVFLIFEKIHITKIAFEDGTGNLKDLTSNQNLKI
jgi:hypothetical protein